MSQVLLRCYDFPPRISGHLFASLPGSTRSSSLRVSQLALPVGLEGTSGPGPLFNRRPKLPVRSHVDVNGTSQVPRRSILCLCPALRPRPNRRSLASLTVSSMLPPRFPRTARASALNEFRGSITRLWHLLPTLQDWCCHHPCKARFRLAGSPLPGGSRTLRIATKGFRSQSHPPFLDLSWRKGSFMASTGDPSGQISRRCKFSEANPFLFVSSRRPVNDDQVPDRT